MTTYPNPDPPSFTDDEWKSWTRDHQEFWLRCSMQADTYGVADDRPENRHEGDCWEHLTSNGWVVHKKGWPDFLCWMHAGCALHVFCVEVKRHAKDKPRDEQLQAMMLLERKGIPCFIWNPENGYTRVGSQPFNSGLGRQDGDVDFPDPLVLRCAWCRGAKLNGSNEGPVKCTECNGTGLAFTVVN